MSAFMHNDMQKVRETLENKFFSIEEKDVHGNTSLHYAAGNDAKGKEMLTLLIRDPSFRMDMVHLRGAEGQTPLHNASERGTSAEIASMLLSVPGVDVNALDNYNQTPLHAAVENEKGACIVEALLRAPGILVNVRDLGYQTPLHLAADGQRGGLAVAKMIMQHGDFDAFESVKPDSRGRTPLHLSAENPRGLELSRILLQRTDVDVNAADIDGLTALHLAVRNSRGLETVRMLLRRRGLRVSSWTNPGSDGWRQLPPACGVSAGDREEIVNMILRHRGIDVNARDDLSQRTWLHTTVADPRESVDMVRMILRLPGVDVNLLDDRNRSAVHLAAGNENGIEVMRILLSHPELAKKSSFLPDAGGRTPLHHAAANRNGLEIVRMLLNQSCHISLDVNAVDRYTKASALHLGVQNAHGLEIVRLLIEHPETSVDSWSTPQADGWFLLHGCENRVPVMRVILQHRGVDLNARCFGGQSWLHKAVLDDERDSLDMVKMLLEHPGIDVNAVDDDHRTPLHCAARNKDCLVMARKIMEHPKFDLALLMYKDTEGETPLLRFVGAGKGTEMSRIIRDFVGRPCADDVIGV